MNNRSTFQLFHFLGGGVSGIFFFFLLFFLFCFCFCQLVEYPKSFLLLQVLLGLLEVSQKLFELSEFFTTYDPTR